MLDNFKPRDIYCVMHQEGLRIRLDYGVFKMQDQVSQLDRITQRKAGGRGVKLMSNLFK